MRAKITTTYEVDGHPALSAQEIVNGAGQYEKDFEVEPGETLTFPLAIEIPLTECLVLVPSADMTFTLGGRQFERSAIQPLIWTKSSGLPCPLIQDATGITITSHAQTGEHSVLHVRVIERSRPAESPAVAPVTEPVAPILQATA